jgi:hypothetical protein
MNRFLLAGLYAGVVLFLAIGIDVAAKVQAWAERPDLPELRPAITAAPVRARSAETPAPTAEDRAAAELAAALAAAMASAGEQALEPEVSARPAKASRATCEQLLDLRERNAVELALATVPKKDKKTRQRVTREVRARIAAYQPETLEECAELTQAEVDCALDAEDLDELRGCGREVNRVLSH